MSLPAENIRPIEPQALVTMTPMDMLSRAVQSGADLDMIEKLMNLQERWEAANARKAFNEAIAAAKAEIKPIVRNRIGHNNKKYADMAAVAEAVDPILSKHGLSYRFRSSQAANISVTCILFHRQGHEEETPLSAAADTSGNKSAIHGLGSTLTYLERYTLMLALGLAASNDDDGKAASDGATISEDQIGDLTVLMQSVGADKAKFLRFFKVEQLAELPAKRFQEAVNMLNAKSRG